MQHKFSRVDISLVAIVLLSVIILHCPQRNAPDLTWAPDTVEYAIGADRLVRLGLYDISINQSVFPPRYPPWFSGLILAPAYVLGGEELGSGIAVITLFALLGVVAAYSVGTTVGGKSAGAVASLCLLATPGYVYFGRQILSDIPCAVVALVLLAHFLQNHGQRETHCYEYLIGGLLVALASAMRPLSILLALPFLFRWWRTGRPGSFRSPMLLFFPSLVVAFCTAWYNLKVFGDPFRSGYHFWTPVPYDFPELVFSVDYLAQNMGVLLERSTLIIFLVALCGIPFFKKWVERNRLETTLNYRACAEAATFVALFGIPHLVLYLLYFFPAERFYLPLTVPLAPVVGAFISEVALRRYVSQRVIVPLAGLATIAVLSFRLLWPSPAPAAVRAVDALRVTAQNDAVIISGANPLYLSRLLVEGTKRVIVPISRRVEYASKLIAPQSTSHAQPRPRTWQEHRTSAIVEAGAAEAIAFVALESPLTVAALVEQGRQVLIDLPSLTEDEHRGLRARFEMREVTPGVVQLTRVSHRLR